MDRLTMRDENGRAVRKPLARAPELLERLARYEETGLEPEDVQKYSEYEFDPESTARIVQTIIRYPLCLKNVADLVESQVPLLHRMDGHDAVKRIANWIQAESEGRLIELPCKVGDVVYAIEPDLCDLRAKDTCCAYCEGWDFSCPDFRSGNTIRLRHFQVEDLRRFGETVFRTHAEAVAALGGDGDG